MVEHCADLPGIVICGFVGSTCQARDSHALISIVLSGAVMSAIILRL